MVMAHSMIMMQWDKWWQYRHRMAQNACSLDELQCNGECFTATLLGMQRWQLLISNIGGEYM